MRRTDMDQQISNIGYVQMFTCTSIWVIEESNENASNMNRSLASKESVTVTFKEQYTWSNVNSYSSDGIATTVSDVQCLRRLSTQRELECSSIPLVYSAPNWHAGQVILGCLIHYDHVVVFVYTHSKTLCHMVIYTVPCSRQALTTMAFVVDHTSDNI